MAVTVGGLTPSQYKKSVYDPYLAQNMYTNPYAIQGYGAQAALSAVNPYAAPTQYTAPTDFQLQTAPGPFNPLQRPAQPLQATVGGVPVSGQAATPGNLLTQRKLALQKELKTNLAISGIAQAAQFGTALIPTTSEIENKRRLKEIELEKAALAEEAKQAGYSPEEKALMQQEAGASVGRMAAESRKREEAAAASMGGTSSARAQVQSRREERRAAQDLAMQSSLRIEMGDIEDAKSDLDTVYQKQQILKKEEDERIEAKGLRQRQLLAQAGQLAGGVAGLAGQVRGAQALEAVDLDKLKNFTPLQQELYLRAIQTGDKPTLQALETAEANRLQMMELTKILAAAAAARTA